MNRRFGAVIVAAALVIAGCSNEAPAAVAPPATANAESLVQSLPSDDIADLNDLPDPLPGYTEADVRDLAAELRTAMESAETPTKQRDVETARTRTLAAFGITSGTEDTWNGSLATVFSDDVEAQEHRLLMRTWKVSLADGEMELELRTINAYPISKPRQGVIVLDRRLSNSGSTFRPSVASAGTERCATLESGVFVPRPIDEFSVPDVQSMLNATDNVIDNRENLSDDCSSPSTAP